MLPQKTINDMGKKCGNLCGIKHLLVIIMPRLAGICCATLLLEGVLGLKCLKIRTKPSLIS